MDIIISNSSGVPIYEQIEEQIKNQIMTGELSAGEILPSMRVLAKELKISIITTKRAYEDLERDGFIESVMGKGTFVKAINSDIVRENLMFSIEELLEEAVDKAVIGNVSVDELSEMLKLLYEEKKKKELIRKVVHIWKALRMRLRSEMSLKIMAISNSTA